MKFALLGADADTLLLAQFIAAGEDHRLVWAHDLGPHRPEVARFAPQCDLAEHWEGLVGGTIADALLVGRGDDDDARAEQLRKLVQAGLPMILAHPIHDSMLIYYELDMIRRDSRCVMLPLAPYRWHDGVARLAEIVRLAGASPVGATEQFVIERALADRSPRSVQTAFARDVDLAASVCGELTSISAMGPQGPAQYANLGVQLSGPAGVLVRWAVGPVEDAPGVRLTIVGDQGKATLRLPAAGEACEVAVVAGGRSHGEHIPAWQPALAAIERLAQAIGGAEVAPAWPDACRAVELTESIDRSLEKGRCIELHHEEHSEHGTFKGTMTSVGCALLCLSLVIFLGAAALAAITGKAVFGYAPHFILGVLALFLLVQLFKLAFPSGEQA